MRSRLLALIALFVGPSVPALAADPAVCHFARDAVPGAPTDALQRLVAAKQEKERGLGGTGIRTAATTRKDRGLGGTGIIGVVTGFASICVNGFEVTVDPSTAVTVGTVAADPGDLRLGQAVAITAHVADDRLVAERVAVRIAVAGPIASIAADGTQLVVAGQTVVVAGFGGSADVEALKPGDWVAVSGLRRPDDAIVGTSIVPLERPGDRVVVAGELRVGAGGRTTVGGLAIDAARLKTGHYAQVAGDLQGDRLIGREVTLNADTPFARPVTTLSVQGYGRDVADELKRLGLRSGARLDAVGGEPTQVNGTARPDGTFTPQYVGPPPVATEGALAQPLPERTRPEGTPSARPSTGSGLRSATPRSQGPDGPRPDRPARPDRPTMPERTPPLERPQIPTLPERAGRPTR